ncbi:unnamed protein product [Vitrella brassicaformis CCMP3155]|uniref:J domain-containing protein n=1 Tax=Vitrella brassicaformis (strain CCMP3155) TaxID=1169540 RepID=A0A0G4FKS6_VITBC|nr:unnamed protein product [Vitrella brassicaformis CCMP3155]|mmetsp:Transcript_26031/g.64611  ORF Transcript_26031/g.64611 Transcript_26031/m.64611 type:complete len:194 (-) Transcript_26031:675-1256(-)|eukprot:CEM13962.1 unnamed protein product [Vitrella brassicaformis CCMP3155]
MVMNHYERLGISKDATKEQIRKAYYSKSKKTHPDKGGTKEAFQKVNEAHEVLSNAKKRRQYDLTLAGGVRKTTTKKTTKSTSSRSSANGASRASRPTNNESNTHMGFGKYFDRTYAWVERNAPGYVDYVLRQGRSRYNIAAYNRSYEYCKGKYGAAAAPRYTYRYNFGYGYGYGGFFDVMGDWGDDGYDYFPW